MDYMQFTLFALLHILIMDVARHTGAPTLLGHVAQLGFVGMAFSGTLKGGK